MFRNSVKMTTHEKLVSPTLPTDILVTEILPRLPPSSLLRFKCLSKFFRNYISSEEFINLHLIRQSETKDSGSLVIFLAASSNKEGSWQRLYLLDLDSESPALCISDLPEPFGGMKNKSRNGLHIVGSCNGLLCVRANRNPFFDHDTVHFMLLNPSTGIARSGISLHDDELSFPEDNSVGTSFGFGYDRKNDDYKIVVVDYYFECYDPYDDVDNYLEENSLYCRKTFVYSSRSSSWRCVEELSLPSLLMKLPDLNDNLYVGVLIDDELLHWISYGTSTRDKFISCFNLEKEQWAADDLPLPDYVYDRVETFRDDAKSLHLGVIDGCLCLSVKMELDKHDVWVMKDYGVKESWMKLYTIPFIQCTLLFPYGIGERKQLLLGELEIGRKRPIQQLGTEVSCVWYNIRDGTTKFFEYTGAPKYFKILSVTLGSLVTVSGGHQTRKKMKITS